MTEFVPFPRGTGITLSGTNYWDGTRWDWPAGNPAWDWSYWSNVSFAE